VNEHRNLPNVDRFSVVVAMILIAYSLTAVITLPMQTINIQLPGFLLAMDVNFLTIVSVLVALLAAIGCDWLISDHPFFDPKTRWQHWFIPALTAFIIGVPLGVMQVSPAWWWVFGLGGVLLAGVLLSEYISVDPGDNRSALASLSLSSVSLALFLTLTISLRGSGFRLYIVLAAIAPATFLVTARSLQLRIGGTIKTAWAAGITLVMIQLATGFYYLPLKPIQFGLLLMGCLFALITLTGNIMENRSPQGIWIEPLLVVFLFSFSAILVH
jgi:hypothetical protein